MLARRGWSTRPTYDNAFSDFEQLRREVMRLFGSASTDGALTETTAGVFPPTNISQDADNFYLRTEIPGVKASDISVTAVRNRVSIAGKREIAREHERVSYHRKERADGNFNRTVTLPVEVDAARVDARYADGILTLTLPKIEAAKPRQIKVHS
jgi:HSP20 family protein